MTGTRAPAMPNAAVDRLPMPVARLAGVLCMLLAAGCAGIGRAPEHEAPTSVPDAPTTAETRRATAAAAPATPALAAASNAVPGAAKPASPAPKVPARAPPAPAPAAERAPAPASAAPPPKAEVPVPALAKPAAAPPLDLKSLETRLRETNAIGVFTKLTVKNQVDDLLDRFREFHKGRLKATLAELRRAYDMLVLKVLALLQDADAPLASDLAASRESIWGILSDREKFSTLQ